PWQQTHHGQRGHAFAAAGLADQAQYFTAAHREAAAIDRLHDAAAQKEMRVQVADFQDSLVAHSWRNRGSIRSRNQSPNRFTDSTRSVIAMPGMIDTHQASAIRPRPSEIISPQVGVGGGMPAPRKLSEASAMTTTPMLRVTSTMNVFNTFGRICVNMIRGDEQPRTWASATKSRCFSASTSPRMTRAKLAQSSRLMAMMSVDSPCPIVTASNSANRMAGNVKAASTNRISRLSTAPPRY